MAWRLNAHVEVLGPEIAKIKAERKVSMSTKLEQLAGVADAIHAMLVKRADELASSIDGARDWSFVTGTV
jgi:hypothetical protein